MRISNGAWVAVCDGGKFLLLQNRGDADQIDLRVIAHEQIDPDSLPGRHSRGPSPDGHNARIGQAQAQSVEAAAERNFVHTVALELNARTSKESMNELVLVADSKTLGMLRGDLSDQTRSVITREIGGDHTHDTVADVEALVSGA